MELKSTSIMIPFYNKFQLVHDRLWEMYEKIPGIVEAEIILADDSSTEKNYEKRIEWWKKKTSIYKNIKVVRTEKNLGYGGNCNNGMRATTRPVVVLLTTDVVIKGNFIQPMLDVLRDNKDETLIGGIVHRHDTGWNQFDGKIYPYAEGSLMCMYKSTWNKLGGFDPRYGRFDYEDMDLCTTAISKGIKLHSMDWLHTRHIGGATIIPEFGVQGRAEITKKNKEIFWSKWRNK